MPQEPPPILMSGFGPVATDLAARIADGYITTQPDKELLGRFRANARPGSVAQAGLKVSYAPTKDEGVDIAHRLWANAGLPGELSQVLPTPAHFEQASTLVSRDMTAASAIAGPTPSGTSPHSSRSSTRGSTRSSSRTWDRTTRT